MDSTVSVTYTLTARVTFTMPDDKLIPFLEGEIDLEPCLNIEMDNLPVGFDDSEINLDRYIQPMEIDCITRGDFENPYDWDGSKLIEL